jgi:hypothetical protein
MTKQGNTKRRRTPHTWLMDTINMQSNTKLKLPNCISSAAMA